MLACVTVLKPLCHFCRTELRQPESAARQESRRVCSQAVGRRGLFPEGGLCLFAGEVVFEGCEQMSDDRDAPGPAQELLPGTAAHVGHVCVVDWKAENPAGEQTQNRT